MTFLPKIAPLLIFLLVLSPLYQDTQGQSSSNLTASTSKSSYKSGETVTIAGTAKGIVGDLPVTILVRNPIQNVYAVGQEEIHNNVFVYDFVIGQNAKPGIYNVDIKYADARTKLQFTVTSGLVQSIPVQSSSIKVRGDSLGLIKYGEVTISTEEKSITIPVEIESTINPIQQEFEIPKEIIDSRQSLTVQVNGNDVDCSQTKTTSNTILNCFIPNDTTVIKFVGTSVIPEFNEVTLVLLISVISAIVFIHKQKAFYL